MLGLNQVLLYGTAGQDPYDKPQKNGKYCVQFSLAVPYKYAGKENTDWIVVRAGGKVAELAAQFVHKGSRVIVTGSMKDFKFKQEQGWSHFPYVQAFQVICTAPKPKDDFDRDDYGDGDQGKATDQVEPEAPAEVLDDDDPEMPF